MPRPRKDPHVSFEVYVPAEYVKVVEEAKRHAKRLDRSLSRYFLHALVAMNERMRQEQQV